MGREAQQGSTAVTANGIGEGGRVPSPASDDSGQQASSPDARPLTWLQAALVAAPLIAAGLIEWLGGRPPICTCGSVKLWAGVVNGPENSQMVADWYSPSHVIHGLLFYAALWLVARRWPVGWRLVVATTIEAAWELLENSPIVIERYRSATASFGYSGDSILNSMSDVVFMIVGFTLARVLPARGSVALGLGLEFASLIAIRDNLTLNVLMLVYPIDAIRVWQSG